MVFAGRIRDLYVICIVEDFVFFAKSSWFLSRNFDVKFFFFVFVFCFFLLVNVVILLDGFRLSFSVAPETLSKRSRPSGLVSRQVLCN